MFEQFSLVSLQPPSCSKYKYQQVLFSFLSVDPSCPLHICTLETVVWSTIWKILSFSGLNILNYIIKIHCFPAVENAPVTFVEKKRKLPSLHTGTLDVTLIIIINIQPTVKVSCLVGYVTWSSRFELQPLTLLCMGFSRSYLTVNFLGFSAFCQLM